MRSSIVLALSQFVASTPLAKVLLDIGAAIDGLFPLVENTVSAVATALPANTVTAGVMTVTANGAFPAQDGVSIALNDVILIPVGATNLTSAVDSGPWQVTTLGTASTQAVLHRPSWWSQGSYVLPSQAIFVGPGAGASSLYGNTEWRAMGTSAIVVGTTTPSLYPREVTQSFDLVAGTHTISNVPVLSTKSDLIVSRTTPNTTALTVAYNPYTLTPGVIGTASVVVDAQIAAGTKNVADISTLTVTVRNF